MGSHGTVPTLKINAVRFCVYKDYIGYYNVIGSKRFDAVDYMMFDYPHPRRETGGPEGKIIANPLTEPDDLPKL